jgi:hypothetical protein
MPLPQFGYPPNQNHQRILLQPQRYLLTASSTWGPPEPSRITLDLRRVSEATIRVPPQVPSAQPAPAVPDAGPFAPAIAFSTRLTETSRAGGEATGTVRARTLEPQASIELESLEPPYTRRSTTGRLDAEVPAGPYRVRFRLGPDVFNEREVYVGAGEVVTVSPKAAVSPLLQEALGIRADDLPEYAVVSETIGPMQAALLPTVLPILGIKPFDQTNQLFRGFHGLVRPRDPDDFGRRPLSLVVAVDGNAWPAPPREVLQKVRCTLKAGEGGAGSVAPLRLTPLAHGTFPDSGAAARPGHGLERIALALAPAPSTAFTLALEAPPFGYLRLAGAALAGRVTVVALTLRPDGSFDLSQNVLPFPGRDYPDEPVPDIPYGKMLRQLQVGQKLYQSGELITHGTPASPHETTFLSALLDAKWTDPILSPMACHAWKQAVERGLPIRRGVAEDRMSVTASRLMRFFGALPDSKVIYGLVFPEEQDETFAALLEQDALPVLAENTRALALHAQRQGRRHAAVVDAARRIPAGQVWTLNLE